MTVAAFDTHSSVKALTAAGFPEVQAEAITALFSEARERDWSTLATKGDFAELKTEFAEVKTELKADIAQVRAEIAQVKAELKAEIAEVKAELKAEIIEVKTEIAEVKTEIAEVKSDILKWTIGMIGGAVVINIVTVVGAMLAVVRLTGH